MHKQQPPLTPLARPLAASLLLCLGQGIALAAAPIIDTDPPTNITLYLYDNNAQNYVAIAAPLSFQAQRPVITLDLATLVASKVVATDAPSYGSASADFPGYPSGEIGPMAPGRHTITWTATDVGNNSYSVTQNIDVKPEVNLAVDQTVGEGNDKVTVTAYLSGLAPIYPVTIGYTVGGSATRGSDHDHGAATGNITIDDGKTSGSVTINVYDDGLGDPGETIIFTVNSLQNDRVIAIADCTTCNLSHTVTISETNLAPIINISATQGGNATPTRNITAGGGLVTLTADVRDPNGNAISGYDWSASDSALVPTEGTTSNIFKFSPTGLTPGVYTARLTARDSLGATSTRDMQLRVYATRPTLSSTEDSDDDGMAGDIDRTTDTDTDSIPDYLDDDDNDGILNYFEDDDNDGILNYIEEGKVADDIEGIEDNDGDGIPNYLDAVTNSAWLPGWDLLTYKGNLKRSDTFVAGPVTFSWTLNTVSSNRVYYPLLLATEPGLKLSVGPTAFAVGSNNARIRTEAASLHFGASLPANIISADGQVVDVEISGLGTTGQSVYLVIPQTAPLPPGSPVFRVIGKSQTWEAFTNDGGNNQLLYKQNKDSGHYCPPPASSEYQAVATNSSALSNTISCVELRIEDGGPNDYDGQKNGIIHLLGAPFITADSGGTAPTPPPEFDGTAKGSVESINKVSLTQGGGGIGSIGLWGVVGLLLAYRSRR